MLGGRWRGYACLSSLFIVVMAVPLRAQIGTGTLVGGVVDQAGAAVPGATVTVVATATNRSRTVVTTPAGTYTVPGLAPGTYRVRVESNGFRPLTRDGVRLATGETVR